MAGIFRAIFNEVHELPQNAFALNWRNTGPLTALMRRLLTDRAAVERMGDCTFRRHAMKMLSVMDQSKQSGQVSVSQFAGG